MNIAGFNPNSMVDYEGNISAVVFTAGCNMRCWYCHNKHILNDCDLLDEKDVLFRIEKNKNFLDAVVITGGEATLQPDIIDFAKKAKDMGLLVKLDTNGKTPDILKRIIESGAVDYIAMDLKAPLEDYDLVTKTGEDADALRESIMLIMESGIPYEFRTTFFPQLGTDDIEKIAKEIAGARRYVIQKYNNVEGFNFIYHSAEDFHAAKEAAQKHVPNTLVKND